MDITLTIDETQPTQTIYSPELDAFLHIDIIPQTSIDDQIQAAKDQIARAQAVIDGLTPVNDDAVSKRKLAEPSPIAPAEEIIP